MAHARRGAALDTTWLSSRRFVGKAPPLVQDVASLRRRIFVQETDEEGFSKPDEPRTEAARTEGWLLGFDLLPPA